MIIGTVSPHPEWRVVVDALKGRDYGAVVSHEEIANLTGLPAQSRRYFSQMKRAKRGLLEWQRELESLPRQGYRLVMPYEFHTRGRRRIRLAGHQIREGVRTAASAPSHLLSDQENARLADLQAKLGSLESQHRQLLRSTFTALPAPKVDEPKMLKA